MPDTVNPDPSQAQTPQFDTPEMLDRKRLLALAMQRQGMDFSPIKSWTQGAARLADALVGGLQERRLDQQERGQNAAMMQALMPYLSSQGGIAPQFPGAVSTSEPAQPSAQPTSAPPHRFADPSVAFEGAAGGGATPSADMFAAATPAPSPTAMTLGPSGTVPTPVGAPVDRAIPGAQAVTPDPKGAMYPGSNIQSMDMGIEPPASTTTALADGVSNRSSQPMPRQQPDPRALLAIASSGGRLAPIAAALLAKQYEQQPPLVVHAGDTVLDKGALERGQVTPLYTAPIKPSASNDPAMAERMQEARTSGQLSALRKSDEVKLNVQAMKEGRQIPEINRMSTLGVAIKAEAEAQGIDLAKLDLQWKAAARHVMSMNSDRQNRFQGLGTSVVNTIDRLKQTSKQMQLSGISGFNQAKLFYLEKFRGNTPEGQLAHQYISDVTTLKEEFAGLVTGGTAPHEAAFALANKQLNEDFGWQNMRAGLDEIQTLINFRLKAMTDVPVQGLSGANPYIPNVPQQSETAPPPTAPTLDQKTTTGTTWGYTP